MIVLTGLILSGCVKSNVDPDPGGDPSKEKKEKIINNLVSTVEYSVPIQEGYTTNVLYNGVLVASTSKAMTILLPKQAATKSGSAEVTVYYQPGTSTISASTLWQTLVFEDSRVGDYDYNDLVFQARYQVTDNNLRVSLQPIALGSTKNIKLGFKWVQGSRQGEVIVAENSREELFAGKTGFINTRNYDVHYNGFVKEIDVPISGVVDPVQVWWFIEVDKGYRINAINTAGADCLDENLKPYGFAISDCGVGPVTRAVTKVVALDNDETLWNSTILPTVYDSWAFMPPVPTIPVDAQSMSTYQTWGAPSLVQKRKIEAGQTYSGPINFISGFELYVEGTLTIENFWGNGPVKIVVMPGGRFNLTNFVGQGTVEILNYGTINYGENTNLQNVTLKNAGSLNVPNVNFTFGTNTKFFVEEGLTASKTHSSGTAQTYIGGALTLSDVLSVTNSAKYFVEGVASVASVNLTASSELYVGCKLLADEEIYVTNNCILSVKGHISTPLFRTTTSGVINIMNGGLLETTDLRISNTGTISFNVVGPGYAVLKATDITFGGGLDLRNTFKGNMYLEYSRFLESGTLVELDNPRLTLPSASVKLNSSEATLPATDCCPGYNSGGGAVFNTWFPYPKEQINISTCYNFDSWMEGVYDFTLKPGAQVFDVYNTSPAQGEQLSVYDMQ